MFDDLFNGKRKRELMDKELLGMVRSQNEQSMKDYDFFCSKIAEVHDKFVLEIKALKQEIEDLKDKLENHRTELLNLRHRVEK